MEGLYKNQYRVPSARLSDWDYGLDAYYFVTICTYGRICYFGEVVTDNDGRTYTKLTDIGRSAEQYWLDIPKYHPYVLLDEYSIMPNHIHGIIQIRKNEVNSVETPYLASPYFASRQRDARCRGMGDARCRVSTEAPSRFGSQSHNLSSIIRGYKSAVTMYARNHHVNFQWQSRFYDHIIRNEKSLEKIREYVRGNVWLWERDRNNPAGLLM